MIRRTDPAVFAALLLLGLLLVPTSSPAGEAETAPKDEQPAVPVSDLDLGLHRGSVFEAAAPPPVKRNQTFPGERPALLRAHPEAPPVTPHGTADFLPITRDQNTCTDCHLVDEKEEGGPTPIPESHFVDYRNAPETVGEEIAGSRWVCTACHVAQTDEAPLVDNRITGAELEPDREGDEGSRDDGPDGD